MKFPSAGVRIKPFYTSILLTAIFAASAAFSQSEHPENDLLTEKGKWYIYKYSKIFECSEPITVEHIPGGKLEGILSIHTPNCNSNLTKKVLDKFVREVYNFGIPEILLESVWVNDSLSWDPVRDDLDFRRPDSIKFMHFKFYSLSDSSYNIFERGNLIIKNFKDRYLENCIYKSDTFDVIRTKMLGKDEWIMKSPCEPFFFSRTKKRNSIYNEEKWKVYTIKCKYSDKSTQRTIGLNQSNNSFRWEWSLGGSTIQITSGYYELIGDSLLILKSDPNLHDEFLTFYNEESKGKHGIPRYIIKRSFLLRNDQIYYINEFQ
ncbi:MAG: hypothetical protein WDZ35_07615 [Crocinitomicaceae bacterium]